MQLTRMVLALMAPGEPTRMWGKCYAIWGLKECPAPSELPARGRHHRWEDPSLKGIGIDAVGVMGSRSVLKGTLEATVGEDLWDQVE